MCPAVMSYLGGKLSRDVCIMSFSGTFDQELLHDRDITCVFLHNYNPLFIQATPQ